MGQCVETPAAQYRLSFAFAPDGAPDLLSRREVEFPGDCSYGQVPEVSSFVCKTFTHCTQEAMGKHQTHGMETEHAPSGPI